VVAFIAQAAPEELNAVDKKGRTMLNALIEEIAIQNRIHRVCLNPVRTRVLAALLDKNADYNIRNGEGKLPIHYAFACSEIFDMLMVHIERTINDPERMSAYVNETMSTTGPGAAPLIFEAASSETDAILHKLLAYGADPNTIATINGVNYTPLKYALSRMHMYSHPHYNIPLLLLARGAHTLDSDNPEPLLIQMLQYNPYGGELSQHNTSARAESTWPDEIVDLMVTMIERIIQANPSPLTMRSVTGETPYMIALKSPYEKIRNIFTPENITRLLEGMGESARAIIDKYKGTVQPPRPNIYGWTPEKILRMKSRNLQ
jgi:ankyrin repeat protein